MNPNSIIKLVSDAFRWSQTRQGRTTLITAYRVAKIVPPIVQRVDSWISSYTYAEAVVKVQQIEKEDASYLKKIYSSRVSDMSPGVRLAFEEALKRRHEI